MFETAFAALGTLAALILAFYLGRLKAGWIFTLSALYFGWLAVYEFRIDYNASSVLAFISVAAAVMAGTLFARTWGIASLTVAIAAAVVTHSVSQAFGDGASLLSKHAVAAIDLDSLKIGITCLLSLALLSFEGRRRAALVRTVKEEGDVKRRLWDGASDGIVIVDHNARVVEWNPAMERLTGIRRKEMMGAALTDCPCFDSDSRHEECLHMALEGIETASEIRFRKDQEHPLSGYYSPLPDQDGKVSGAIAIITPRARHVPSASKGQEPALLTEVTL